MAGKMDAQVTLTTSDDPPVTLTISRSALVTHSKVFADMLSLNLQSEAGDKSIPVAETRDQLRTLLSMIEGGEEEREGALSGLDENGWINLAKLADKYDCWAVRKSVEDKAWEINASDSNPKLAFALGTICRNKQLIQSTARSVVLLSSLEGYPHITAEWRHRLYNWKGLQSEKLLKCVYWHANELPWHASGCTQSTCEGSQAWNRLIGRAFKHYDLNSSPPIPVRNEVHHLTMCDISLPSLMKKAVKFEKETSEWIEFPV